MNTVNADDSSTKPIARFVDGISLSDIISGAGASFEINFDDLKVNVEDENIKYDCEDVMKYANLDCLGLQDEETYNDSEPFEELSKKMVDLETDKVKKRILREGVGELLSENSLVICDYNAYIEYNEEPFDSTYIRKKPFKYRLGSCETLAGLEIAIRSMKINEKSQFLIHPDLAYGKMGCLNRVPSNSTVLFEIEIKNCLNTGASISYQKLSEDKQMEFKEIFKYAQALILKGNDLFVKKCYKAAIREYNIAASKLESCVLEDYEEQEQQQLLLLRIYTNLVVTYTVIKEPRQACKRCNYIYHMANGTSLTVPAKVYFNHARSLVMLGEYKEAEHKLKRARKMEPNNRVISDEFIKLDDLKKEDYDREMKVAKVIFSNNAINKELNDIECVSDEFKKIIVEQCQELKNDAEKTQYNLPPNLSKGEIEHIKGLVGGYNLKFKEFKGKFSISKCLSTE